MDWLTFTRGLVLPSVPLETLMTHKLYKRFLLFHRNLSYCNVECHRYYCVSLWKDKLSISHFFLLHLFLNIIHMNEETVLHHFYVQNCTLVLWSSSNVRKRYIIHLYTIHYTLLLECFWIGTCIPKECSKNINLVK